MPGSSPAGSRDTLRVNGIGERESKGERKRPIFLGLHRKPIKPLTWDLPCSWRPQAPSRWGEDAERLLERVLETRTESELRGPLCSRGSAWKRRKKERERERKKEWHKETKLRWNRVCSFIFKKSFYTLSYTFPEVKDVESCRVSSTIHLFNPYQNQDVCCIPFHLKGLVIIFWLGGLLTCYDPFLIKVGQPENLFFL